MGVGAGTSDFTLKAAMGCWIDRLRDRLPLTHFCEYPDFSIGTADSFILGVRPAGRCTCPGCTCTKPRLPTDFELMSLGF
jgi:hypothetical protein